MDRETAGDRMARESRMCDQAREMGRQEMLGELRDLLGITALLDELRTELRSEIADACHDVRRDMERMDDRLERRITHGRED